VARPEPREEPRQAEAPRPVEQPHQIEQPRPVEAPRPAAPRVDTREVLANAGLQMVETSSKVSAPLPETEPVKLGRPRRERNVQAPQEESLVQVETRDK
jgi:hypothetical protein